MAGLAAVGMLEIVEVVVGIPFGRASIVLSALLIGGSCRPGITGGPPAAGVADAAPGNSKPPSS